MLEWSVSPASQCIIRSQLSPCDLRCLPKMMDLFTQKSESIMIILLQSRDWKKTSKDKLVEIQETYWRELWTILMLGWQPWSSSEGSGSKMSLIISKVRKKVHNFNILSTVKTYSSILPLAEKSWENCKMYRNYDEIKSQFFLDHPVEYFKIDVNLNHHS